MNISQMDGNGIISVFCQTWYFNVVFAWEKVGELQHRIIRFNTFINISFNNVSEWNPLENFFIFNIYPQYECVIFPWNLYVRTSISDVCGRPLSSIPIKYYFEIWLIRVRNICVNLHQPLCAAEIKIRVVFLRPLLVSEYYFIGMKPVASVPLDKLFIFCTIREQLVLRANPYPLRRWVIAECVNIAE